MASASAKRTRATAALLMLGLSACVARTPATVSLRVKGNVPDASVTIDDQYIGALAYVAAHGVALPPGAHRITVEKAGYFAWDRLVEARSGAPPIHLQVQLTPVPD
ncbi:MULTISPECIES: PEGA domain-containing protein [Sorangium]|uniref:PEGA domain-containing protein n=1 Tax=Sorangium atrum TaxID=2995308 RepID=A0ABT5C6C4_9BACT|nr:PEGA domain-containing protein [Sorangium aterium]MDC0681912.1 PEGA domain-containing protein [Sorangium aterium]